MFDSRVVSSWARPTVLGGELFPWAPLASYLALWQSEPSDLDHGACGFTAISWEGCRVGSHLDLSPPPPQLPVVRLIQETRELFTGLPDI